MKKIFLLFTAILGIIAVNQANALPSFKYTATAYTTSGQIVVPPTKVEVSITINDGARIFTETFTGTQAIEVCPFGAFCVEVGTGTNSGNLSQIEMKSSTTITVKVRPQGTTQWVTVVGQALCLAYMSCLAVNTEAELPDLTYGYIFIGNSSNQATPRLMSGDATINSNGLLTLANSGVNPDTYGDATHVPVIKVDSKGRIFNATSIAIAFPSVADDSPTNELNSALQWLDATNTLEVVDMGGIKSTQITGFLETEVDPEVGMTSTGAMAKWDGTKLVDALAGIDYLAPFSGLSNNLVYASPAVSPGGAPSFRALVDDDIPDNITVANFTGNLNGEVTGTQLNTEVSSIGAVTRSEIISGVTAANLATSSNVATYIVKRDASGNFSAGTITATLNGNASTATNATNAGTAVNFSGNLSGDVTGTQGNTLVERVGGATGETASYVVTGARAANGAQSANVNNSIVKRDASGNFTAGIITATLSGTASSANALTAQYIDWNAASGPTSIANKPTGLAPSGAAGGDLSGNYPNPEVLNDSHNHSASTLPTDITYLGSTIELNSEVSGILPAGNLPSDIVYDADLAAWNGSANLTTLGTINSGTWQGSVIGETYLPSTIVYTDESYSNPSWLTSLAWSKITGAPAFLTSETDPVYSASSWYTTTNNSADWNTAFSWGNHTGLYAPIAHVGSNGITQHSLVDGTNAGFMSSADFAKLGGIEEGAEVNVNADWNAASGDAQILNKPTSMPPSGAAGGDLSGNYPNPEVLNDSHNHSASTLPTDITYLGSTIELNSEVSGILPAGNLPSDIVYDADLAAWTGSTNLTTLGTITTGTWQGNEIGAAYLPNDIIYSGDLASWTGSTNLTTLGTITTGTWQGSVIGTSYLPSTIIYDGDAAGGDLTGFYPNPSIADAAVTSSKIDNGTILPEDLSAGDYSSIITSGTYTINISGNAGTVTNGVYTNQTYDDPAWINTLAFSKITGTPANLPPSGSAGGDLSGTYPNPGVVDNSHNHDLTTITTDIVSSINSITNDGGNITIVGGNDLEVVTDNVAKTITINSTAIAAAFGYGETINPNDGYSINIPGGYKHYTYFLSVVQDGGQDGELHLPAISSNGNCIILVYEVNNSNDDLTVFSGDSTLLISGIDSSNQYMFVYIAGEWKYVGEL